MSNIENLQPDPFISAYSSDENAIVLDVRTPEETASGHIENAEFADFYNPNFMNTINEMDKTKNYYIYCRSGVRSLKTCELMASLGFKGKLVNLLGGALALQ
ncbi:MAG: rhodanese-like domain-containing protein [Flavobacteriales bacterium]